MKFWAGRDAGRRSRRGDWRGLLAERGQGLIGWSIDDRRSAAATAAPELRCWIAAAATAAAIRGTGVATAPRIGIAAATAAARTAGLGVATAAAAAAAGRVNRPAA